jgi:hypothetical protein
MTPDENAAIKAHLYMSSPSNGVQYQSSFIAVLNDARGAAERDGNGVVLPGRRSVSWLAATGYLVLLDQIGKCFEPLDAQVIADNNPIIHALMHFSHIQDEKTLGALVALRNALTHDYGLFNPDHKCPLRHHAFNYGADETTPLVQLPARRWSGRWDMNIPEEESTIVNLRKVGDLAEEVVTALRSNYEAKTLILRLPLPQFRVRFGMRFRVEDA